MNADESLRPVGRSREPGDRDRRRIGADDGLRLQRRTQRREDLAFSVFLLGGGFDDKVAVTELFERIGRRDALERVLALLVADALAADLARQIAVDGGECGRDAVGRNVVEQDMIAGQRTNVGDTVAHLARADDPDLAD